LTYPPRREAACDQSDRIQASPLDDCMGADDERFLYRNARNQYQSIMDAGLISRASLRIGRPRKGSGGG
jgi:hypothetical protein